MDTEFLFPSQRWFEALARQMIENGEGFRVLGPIDCTMVVKVDAAEESHLFEVVFETYQAKTIRPLKTLDAARPDHFVIEAPVEVWREMLRIVRDTMGTVAAQGGKPSLESLVHRQRSV